MTALTSSTYPSHMRGAKVEDESVLVSKAPMKILAIIGEIGDPVAKPFICSYSLPLNWKYVVVKQNSSSSIMSDGDMVVRSGKDTSNRRRYSVSLITSLTGTLVNSDSTSKKP